MSTPPPLPPDSGGAPSEPTIGEPRLPWEERDRLGLFEALVQTVRLLVTDPSNAFSRLSADGDLTSPMLFGIFITWVCMLFSQMWNLFISQSLRGLGDIDGLGEIFRTPSLAEIIGSLVLWPILFVVIAFISAGILHVCLLLVGATDQSELGFEGTLKVYVYATVAWFAVIIPIAGGVVASLWQLVLLVLGFASVHRTTQGRSLVAVLIPTIVCCVCIIGVSVVFGAVIYKFVEELMNQGAFQ